MCTELAASVTPLINHQWLLCINYLFIRFQVNTTGIFELNLKRFENENGVNADGNCCAGVRTGARCTSWCRTFFRVCLTHYQATITDDVHCNFAEKFTPVLTHGNNSVDFSNLPVKFDIPIKFPFQFAWPVSSVYKPLSVFWLSSNLKEKLSWHFVSNRKRNICKKMSFEINNKWGMVDLIPGDVHADYRSLAWQYPTRTNHG